MKIGIDITVLQTGHRKRGVGYTLINFINHLSNDARKDHQFVFYKYPDEATEDPLNLLETQDLSYEVRTVQRPNTKGFNLPGKFSVVNSFRNYAITKKDMLLGDSRITQVRDLDWFLQFDQHQLLPPKHKVKSTLILYDLIQYIMESDYLPSYKTARSKKHSRKGSLRLHLLRRNYLKKMKKNTRRAKSLVAISEHTKKDFIRLVGVPAKKISVALLGVEPLLNKSVEKAPTFDYYVDTSWGYLPKSLNLDNKKFLLFVGGADPRRKLVDLVAAFNNLRAQGHDIKLVLAGDTMLGAFKVPHLELQKYLKHTSYLDDIYFVGFVDDQQRDWLYQNALAFVYPSVYEGFGLPVLEAMQYGTPVITYKNSSIEEIAGNAALYANDYWSIAEHVSSLIDNNNLKADYSKRGTIQAAKFSWEKTARGILESAG